MTKSVFHYKGYIGSIEPSVEDLCLYGKILFIDDLITYEATTPKLLKKEFESAVNDYLAACERLNKTPQTPFKGSLNVRIGAKLHKEIAIHAKLVGISINEYIKKVLQHQIEIEAT